MPKLKSYGILTSGEISEAEHLGTLSIADHLSCPFCDGTINTKTGEREIEQPFCETCGVYLPIVWEIHQDRLQVRWFPRTKDVRDPDTKEIKQLTGSEQYVPMQRDGTIADEILAFLNKKPIAATAEIRQATQSTPNGFSLAVKKLIATGQVRKIKRGWYERITADADVESST